jgi:hypothetical protein
MPGAAPARDSLTPMRRAGVAILIACLLGIPAGVGAFTFVSQWRLDFVAAENSMGFHAPQETARILGETIDLARQSQLEAARAARRK